ncbi:membrane dipeptidase [Nitratireductor aquibiodomus]|uniref:Membrane dipeptidase n=1 Tax=Nitratireductor aquibiodomus TaxID=204799 RepID=A0A1H4L3F6_9HYPH|nr:membrane dipeptidase [Nitratireductor aquibiodomus]SEB65284.1 membrane dipeptidase [Nitratireductor aquibiodomus]
MNDTNKQAFEAGTIVDGLYCATLTREQFEKTLAGGVRAVNLTATTPNTDLATCMSTLASLCAVVEKNADRARIVTSVKEMREAAKDNVLGIIIGTQDSTFLDHDVNLLHIMKRLGMRIMQPVYNEENRFGHGALADREGRLSQTGHQWVELMNALRLQIDLSHCGYVTARDVLAASKRPVIFSHSNARALCESPRNIPDDLARKAAETGGTVGVTLWPPLLGIEKRPTLEDFCDHVDHYVNLVGIDHVAFGSDLSEGTKTEEKWLSLYGPKPVWPEVTGILGDWYTYENRATPGFETMAEAGNLRAALGKRGYKDDAVDKIMRDNLLRVYEEVWGE